MKLLEDAIKDRGRILENDVLKIDSFLNHLIDVKLSNELGKEFHRLFADCGVTKIMTVEASGIGLACLTAQYFDVPVLFAKKSRSSNISKDCYTSELKSYTYKTTFTATVSKEFLLPTDKVLIIDDFLATGNAMFALTDLVKQSGAQTVGIGIAVEKVYQGGGAKLTEMGYKVESLARIASMTDGNIVFC